MKRALLVHGFNVRDHGAGTVGRLRPVLTRCGYQAWTFPYGHTWLIEVMLSNDNYATQLASRVKDDEIDLLVVHSNGARVAHIATHMLDDDPDYKRKLRMIYIAPALRRSAPLANCVSRCKVLASLGDWACRAAWLLGPFGWGPAGTYGMTAPGYDSEVLRDIRHSAWMRDDRTLYETTEPLIAAELAIPPPAG